MMKWADVATLYRYWRDSPPVHEIVGDYLGVRRSSRGAEADRSQRPDIGISAEELLRVFESGAAVPLGAQ